VETVQHGQNRIRHPALAAYYDKLALVTQGPLLSARRVVEAFKLSLGFYDAWLADYVAFQDQKPVEATSLPPALTKPDDGAMRDCPTWWRRCAPIGAAFTGTGLRVTLAGLSHASAIDFHLTTAHGVLAFWSNGVAVGRQPFDVTG